MDIYDLFIQMDGVNQIQKEENYMDYLKNTMIYLEIHDAKDGMNQFNCGTRHDWYVLYKNLNIRSK